MRVKTHVQIAVVLSFAVLTVGMLFGQSGDPQNERVNGTEPAAQKLPLRRVVLYKSGVGYFEHTGQVKGNENVEIDLTSAQLDDVLKSLTALDMNGGRIAGASYNSKDPANHQLGALSVPVAEKRTLADLLLALRGAQVAIHTGSEDFSGRLLSVEEKTKGEGETQTQNCEISVLSDAGEMRSFRIEPGTSLRFLDAKLEQQLARALGLLDASHAQDARRLVLTATGSGAHELRVSYLSEVPVWKTTYRIVIPENASEKPLLQGWAIVDNTVGEDWNNVELSLAAGAPQSFVQQISQPYYARRPVMPMPVAFQLTPQTHAETLSWETGSLSGTVTDPQHASVAGAEVSIFDSNDQRLVQTTSDSEGDYRVFGLPAGKYRVEITKTGFSKTVIKDVEVEPGEAASVDTALRVGQMAQTVTVMGSAGALVETENASVASVSVEEDSVRAARDAQEEFLAAAQTISAARGRPLGDLFEYKIRDKVSIQKNQSALVPIVQTDVTAEKIALWHAGMNSPRPLRALWFTNSNNLVLDGGTFSVVDGGSFAGEGFIDSMQPGEKRIISYAADLGLQVIAEPSLEPGRVTRVRVHGGTLTRISAVAETTVYTLHNEDSSARTVIIEHPVRQGYQLDPLIHPEEKTAIAYRFRVNVEAKKSVEFRVRENRLVNAEYALGNFSEEILKIFLQGRELNPALEQALRQLLAQKNAVAGLEAAMKAKQSESEEVFKDQSRLRENMKALRGSAEEKALTERYTRELDAQETQLATLRREIAALEVQQKKAQAELDAMIEKMAFDIPI
ncbi:MAG TPA: carboxypeptidase regulatory-like domain-containing protein [Candidatus Acidoferrales bacterium]|nr:carboxypeptidase regulatory-like domain-containing protein [Candidatus Acidoferrales bacterium]